MRASCMLWVFQYRGVTPRGTATFNVYILITPTTKGYYSILRKILERRYSKVGLVRILVKVSALLTTKASFPGICGLTAIAARLWERCDGLFVACCNSQSTMNLVWVGVVYHTMQKL